MQKEQNRHVFLILRKPKYSNNLSGARTRKRAVVRSIGIGQLPFPHKRTLCIQKCARRNRPVQLVRSAKEALSLRTAGSVVVLRAASDRK
jgi:hypothetical protein